MLYYLDKDVIWFPPVHEAIEDGLLAFGGDLTPEWLLEAYSKGIFPWFNSDTSEILWWSPDPRFILFPDELKIPRSLKQVMKKKIFTVSMDKAFQTVIAECAKPRKNDSGTWITPRMKKSYTMLHTLGYAHSVEVWKGAELVGGLYGVSLGKAFFGESMFTKIDNASKIALLTLVAVVRRLGFTFIDCQVYTDNLKRFGARFIAREDFINLLNASLVHQTRKGSWDTMIQDGYDYLQCLNEAGA
ncbi:MAG: leucyl/phenylalanyl-tRNA--protein transferase [Spirochaetes bacterium]|nr:leucyl/phenylalanyl-tRNA--protein transferase [Spirochaetota bacterium]